MKTGRLLKFQRPQGAVHVYLYRDDEQFRAALYLMAAGQSGSEPIRTLDAADESRLEGDVRAWIDAHFPRTR